jgi:hypothetical protein
MIEGVVAQWLAHVFGPSDGGVALDELLDDDVVFYSPIVFTPQRGKAVTTLYLQAATQTFGGRDSESGSASGGGSDSDGGGAGAGSGAGGGFRYTKTVLGGDTAMLEFETTMQGTYVNGVDIIRCNDEGRIIEFRVMIRPLQAVTVVHQQMAAMLEAMEK